MIKTPYILVILFFIFSLPVFAAKPQGEIGLRAGFSRYQYDDNNSTNAYSEEEINDSLPGFDTRIYFPLSQTLFLNFEDSFEISPGNFLNNNAGLELLKYFKSGSSFAAKFGHTYEGDRTESTNDYDDNTTYHGWSVSLNYNWLKGSIHNLAASLNWEMQDYTKLDYDSSLEDGMLPSYDLYYTFAPSKYNVFSWRHDGSLQWLKGYRTNYHADTYDTGLDFEYKRRFILGGSMDYGLEGGLYYSWLYPDNNYISLGFTHGLEVDFLFDHAFSYDMGATRKFSQEGLLGSSNNIATVAADFSPEIDFLFFKHLIAGAGGYVQAERYDAETNRNYSYRSYSGKAEVGFKHKRLIDIRVQAELKDHKYYDFSMPTNDTTEIVVSVTNSEYPDTNGLYASITNFLTNEAGVLPGDYLSLVIRVPVTLRLKKILYFTYQFEWEQMFYDYADSSLTKNTYGHQFFNEYSLTHDTTLTFYLKKFMEFEFNFSHTTRRSDDGTGNGQDIEGFFTTRYIF